MVDLKDGESGKTVAIIGCDDSDQLTIVSMPLSELKVDDPNVGPQEQPGTEEEPGTGDEPQADDPGVGPQETGDDEPETSDEPEATEEPKATEEPEPEVFCPHVGSPPPRARNLPAGSSTARCMTPRPTTP